MRSVLFGRVLGHSGAVRLQPHVVWQAGGACASVRHDSVLPRCRLVREHHIGGLFFYHHLQVDVITAWAAAIVLICAITLERKCWRREHGLIRILQWHYILIGPL